MYVFVIALMIASGVLGMTPDTCMFAEQTVPGTSSLLVAADSAVEVHDASGVVIPAVGEAVAVTLDDGTDALLRGYPVSDGVYQIIAADDAYAIDLAQTRALVTIACK